ncbi:patatin-like phospholipase domain-containing protein 5 isoform X2 [Acinonyx jubatus]|uniref:Patatin-like phospholipase domain-containing protein 5 isoform X2 n=1 Tax=Acinonyx jubatus TaxID=32536 RepID=A0ABM3QG18_ACIJB|nr:patatin-like phospholipase domain-containing protein 5 isoform X2 [Acinonyx jubatus]
MHCYEEEGSWSLSFAGAGFLGLYHVGVTSCLRERAPHLLRGARRFYGSSSGALNAISIVSGKTVDFCCSHVLGMVKQVERLSLGIFHPAFAPIEHIRQQLQDLLPTDIHVLASQRLGISLTRWPDGHNIIVTDFATRREVIQALVCTLYIPFYCGTIPPEFRGERYFDGGLSNNLPFADSPSTITVSPFHGTVDICPQSTSASIHELNTFNASFQISTKNFFLGFASLISPSPEMVADNCRQGYLDALRFLERRGWWHGFRMCRPTWGGYRVSCRAWASGSAPGRRTSSAGCSACRSPAPSSPGHLLLWTRPRSPDLPIRPEGHKESQTSDWPPLALALALILCPHLPPVLESWLVSQSLEPNPRPRASTGIVCQVDDGGDSLPFLSDSGP